MEPPKFEITIEEFYQIVGEIEVVRRKQSQQIQSLYSQINEMIDEITRLKNGGLGKTDNNE